MNAAARFVLCILGLVATATTGTLCVLALRSGDGKDVKEIAVFALGAVAGVLAKVGYDAGRELKAETANVTADTANVTAQETKP